MENTKIYIEAYEPRGRKAKHLRPHTAYVNLMQKGNTNLMIRISADDLPGMDEMIQFDFPGIGYWRGTIEELKAALNGKITNP